MAKAQTIAGLAAGMPFRASLPAVFGVRIAELWSWSRYLPEAEKVQELHDMRIAAKRLRYCFEFYGPCFGKELRPALERFKKLQDFLGEIHDCDVWADKLKGELGDYLKALRRSAGELNDCAGAAADCLKPAAALRRQLAAPTTRGLLLMLSDVVRRRVKLHRDLLAYWDSLEQADFRGELISVVAKAASRQGALAEPPLQVAGAPTAAAEAAAIDTSVPADATSGAQGSDGPASDA